MTAFSDLVQSYLDLRWNLDPVAATAAGVTRYDDRLGVFGAEDVRQYLAALRSLGSALEECSVDGLDEEIDRTALLDELRFTIHLFDHERPHVANPTFWVSHALEAIHLLMVHSDRTDEERSTSVAARVRDIPRFLELARNTLHDCPTVFVETAVGVVAEGGDLLAEVERLWRAEAGAEPDLPEACDAAREALLEFGDYLREDLLESGTAEFAIGEEAFNFRLHFQHALRTTAPELWRYGLALVDDVERQVSEIAREIEPNRPWRDVVEWLRADHPTSSELIDAYAAHMERSRRFVDEKGLVSIPSGRLDVVATPDFLRPLIPFAAYQPPGAFSSLKLGWFYVTPPDRSADSAQQERLLRAHCAYDIPSTALHEGFPGHHLQFLAAQALPSAVRKTVGTALTIEGWALYCEEMMAEQGFFATPEERLFQKVALLWRACRIVLDVGLHTRGMRVEDAVELLVDRVAFDRSQAEAEVRRYCAEPTYQLCYAVGLRELMALREAYEVSRGSDFSLRRFHDDLLCYGGLPVSLIRWGMGIDE